MTVAPGSDDLVESPRPNPHRIVRKEDVAGDKHLRNWWIVDAEGKTLGRVATQIACALRGKHKAVFAPHSDVGDFVIESIQRPDFEDFLLKLRRN